MCSGVYALGGRPGVGKTTFAWQLLKQLVKATIILVTRIKAQSYDTEIELRSFTSEVISEADVVWGVAILRDKKFRRMEKGKRRRDTA